jgi:hypothetical protein
MTFDNYHLIRRPNWIVMRREPSAPTRFYFVKHVKECGSITNEGIQLCPHTMAYKEGLYDCSDDVYL